MGEPSVINTAAEKLFARVTDGCYPRRGFYERPTVNNKI
jgi:hypothetical protein